MAINLLKTPSASFSGMRQIHASAGSGKTYALTARYLSELAAIKTRNPKLMGSMAAGILAITFTNAAANEMRERIIRRLKSAALGSGAENPVPGQDPARAAQWLHVFLTDFNALNIRTIDSLLHQIIRAAALDLHINPDYEPVFDANEAFQPLVDAFLKDLEQDGPSRDMYCKACAALAETSGGGFGRSAKVVSSLAKLLEDAVLNRYARIAPLDAYAALESALKNGVQLAAEKLLDMADLARLGWQPRKRPPIAAYARGEFPKNLASVAASPVQDLFKASPPPQDIADAFDKFIQAAEDYHKFMAISPDAKNLTPLVSIANMLADKFVSASQETPILLQCLATRYAIKALAQDQGVSDALCRLGTRLRCVLVDEFQDTGQDQWQSIKPLVLEALSRGGSLTWVGDVKQSIYAWRGGDPDLFDEPRWDEDLLAVAPNPIIEILDTNRRSRREIVEYNNRFFASLADPANAAAVMESLLPFGPPRGFLTEAADMLAASYKDVKQEFWEEKGDGGFISFRSFQAAGADANRQSAIAILRDILEQDIGARRPWSDALVLVRGAKEAALAVEALTKAKIPVITENGLQLTQNAILAEIIAFLRFLDNPDNDVACWGAAMGRIVATHPLAASIAGQLPGIWANAQDKRPFFQKFQQHFPQIWNCFFSPFYDQAGILTAYDTIREYVSRLQALERFPEDRTMLRRLLELASELENNGVSSISDFLEYWDEKGDQEKAPMPENMNAVRIMTIHKAKGLQAPVVIIPSTMFGVKASDTPAIEEINGLRLPVKSKKALGESHFRAMAMQAREAINLLYVAMTRAEEELHIIHSTGNVKRGGDIFLDRAVDLLLEMANLDVSHEIGIRPPSSLQPKADEQAEEKHFNLAPLEPDWLPMIWLPKIRIFRTQNTLFQLSPVERGTLAHAALERLDYNSPSQKSAENALDMALSFLAMKITNEDRQAILKSLVWIAKLPQTKIWRQTGLAEQSYLDGAGKLLRPDLVAPTPYGALVIDYKTGQPRDEHINQIRAYLDCLAASGEFSGSLHGLLIYLDLCRFRQVSKTSVGELVAELPEGI